MSKGIINSVNLLYPKLQIQLNSAIKEAKSIGLDVYIFETWRSPERQDLLFEQVPKVTNARGWSSWHQYGLAADVAFGGPGKWHWQGPFETFAMIAVRNGLTWPLPKKDPGHVEYNHRLTLAEAKQIVDKNSILGVWSYLEIKEKNEVN